MRTYKTRIEMLKLVKKNAVMCELGVLRGDFAEIILGVCDPKELVLVDVWPKLITSGDVNGNNMEEFDGHYLHDYVKKRFKYHTGVKVVQSMSVDALNTFPDNYFDCIYIDADHRYEGSKADLIAAYSKIKKNGFIMGHDYEMNPAKTDEDYEFGIKQAVTEFCTEFGQKLYAKGMDGCVSFAIKVKK